MGPGENKEGCEWRQYERYKKEPLEWIWKFWAYSGLTLFYAGSIGYIILVFYAIVYYAIEFVR